MPSELLTGCRCGAEAAPLWAEMPKKFICAAKQKNLQTFTTSSALHPLKTLKKKRLFKPALFIVWTQRWTCPLSWQLWTSLHEEPCWGGTPRCPWLTTTCWPSHTIKVKVSNPVKANWTSCLEKELQLPSHQKHKTSLKIITNWFVAVVQPHFCGGSVWRLSVILHVHCCRSNLEELILLLEYLHDFYNFLKWQRTRSWWKATSRSTSCPTWAPAPATLWLCTPPKARWPAALWSPTSRHVGDLCSAASQRCIT